MLWWTLLEIGIGKRPFRYNWTKLFVILYTHSLSLCLSLSLHGLYSKSWSPAINKKNIGIRIYKYKDNTNTSDVIDLVIGSNADSPWVLRNPYLVGNFKPKERCTLLCYGCTLFFNFLIKLFFFLYCTSSCICLDAVARKTQGPSPCFSTHIEDSIAVPLRKIVPLGLRWKIKGSQKRMKASFCFYAYAAAECYRSWSHLSPIEPVRILAPYPRRPEDHKKIPIPSDPIQIRSFYPDQYPINTRSIYLLRGAKITSIQHRNTPISSIQIPCVSFCFFRGLFRTTTWPSLSRAQSIFSLRELDQFLSDSAPLS
mgnify:CR=1 FL=1